MRPFYTQVRCYDERIANLIAGNTQLRLDQ